MTVNFYGDRYIWFEGLVEDRDDPLKMGRVKVRVFGLHTDETAHIPTSLLPWASVAMPVSSASINGIGRSPTGIVEGTHVVGFFRDGESMQDPIVTHTLPGKSTAPARPTRSNLVTTPGERAAVYNDGVDPETGELVPPIKQLELNKNLDINLLIIHCAATKPSMDVGAKEIDQWHKARGWSKIGYHFVIRRNGVVEMGRPITETGAHAKGYNRKSIGICMVGGIDERGRPDDNFTHAQWEQLKTMVAKFMKEYPGIKVIGHNEVAAKACPSFNVQNWLAKIFPDGQVAPGTVTQMAVDDSLPTTPVTQNGIPTGTTTDKQNYVASLALIESGGDPNAKAPVGTAAGMYQFTEGTWTDTTKQMGKNYTLDDRYDPVKATEVATFYTNRQESIIESKIGRQATSTDLYAGHFLGANGGATLINTMKTNPNAPAAVIFPGPASRNKTIFYNKDGTKKSVTEVYGVLGDKVSSAENAVATNTWGKGTLPTSVYNIAAGPKKALDIIQDGKLDTSETEAFAADVAKGAAIVNPNYTENNYGFTDPAGVYPREPLIGQSDTNRLGRNDPDDIETTIVSKKTAGVEKAVPTAGGEGNVTQWDEPVTPYNAQYPFNHVQEYESGHITEFDDTPGKERIHTYHKSGTFEEIHPNGTVVHKIVKDNYTIIAGDDFVLVKGTVNMTVIGNTTLNVEGNVDAKVGGNVTGQVVGDVDVNVDGATTIKSKGDMTLHSDGKMILTAPGGIYEN